MLEVSQLTVAYGKKIAVRGVNLRVEQGQAVFVVGPNGAGKSTIMKSIAGLLKPAQGNIFLNGHRIDGEEPENLAKQGLALVPEGRNIFATLTVQENLLVALSGIGRARGTSQMDNVLGLFPRLRERIRQQAGYLSGGEQQQLALARALVQQPKLLLVDEPSLGLAPMVIDQVYETLAVLKANGVTLLVVEQNTARIEDFGDRAYVLNTGRIVASLDEKAIIDEEAVHEAYFGY